MSTKKVAVTLLTGLVLSLVLLSFGATAQAKNSSAAAKSGGNKDVGNGTDGKVVFTLRSDASLSDIVQTFHLSNVVALPAPLTYDADVQGDSIQVAATMNFDLRVKAADPDYILSVLEGSWNLRFDGASTINGTSSPQAISQYHTQYAWNTTNLAGSRGQGAGVTVAVLDTGVDYNHPELQGHLLNNGYSPIDDGDGMDVNGHGTFVAGLVAWAAPQAKILPVRVLDANGTGTLSSMIKGIQYAVGQGATVLNLSFGTTTSLKTLDKLSEGLVNDFNITVVAAAGNNNSSIQNYPAALSNIIGVSATDSQDYKASFANYGDYVVVSAPGVNIYSTFWHGGYGYADGTSFSTPMVVSAVANYRSLHVNAKSKDVKKVIQTATHKIPSACHCDGIGGRLDFSLIH